VAAGEDVRQVLSSNEPQILKLARAGRILLADRLDVPRASARAVLSGGGEIAVPLEGLIDFDKERERLKNSLAKLEVESQRLHTQLSNQNFVEKAPEEKVQELRDRHSEIGNQMRALKQNIEALDI
jgi:valyl-tRNA synthetase